jgi:CxxC motif-containing protein (DUF1111 family)
MIVIRFQPRESSFDRIGWIAGTSDIDAQVAETVDAFHVSVCDVGSSFGMEFFSCSATSRECVELPLDLFLEKRGRIVSIIECTRHAVIGGILVASGA